MRFAAIADVHGNYLALEAVLADILAQDVGEIVNLGDMASGPLDARRAMDALMALDAVHVLGNHDRALLRYWRQRRGLSQLEADVSSRHLSFLESNRAKPSEEMVLRLLAVLAVLGIGWHRRQVPVNPCASYSMSRMACQ